MPRLHRHRLPSFSLLTIALFTVLTTVCAQRIETRPRQRNDMIIVKPFSGKMEQLHTRFGTKTVRHFPRFGGIQEVALPAGMTVTNAIKIFKATGMVEYAEPDYIFRPDRTPNDSKYGDGTQWGLHNIGQNGGTIDADIDAPAGWGVRSTSEGVIVAVLDSGILLTHEDLRDNLWKNPGEYGKTVNKDDDGNGIVDDIYGANMINGSGNPNDGYGHGTFVAGLIGARGNNAIGMVGVTWSVKLMAVKTLDDNGAGTTGQFVAGVDYAISKGARIINSSIGLTPGDDSLAVRDAIAHARDKQILWVQSAGNQDYDIDSNLDQIKSYPAAISLDNLIAVANTTRNDDLWRGDPLLFGGSSFGLVSVHLGAPGHDIYSTSIGSVSSYAGGMNGTSFSTPLVSGALALMCEQFPNDSYLQLKNRLLSSVDPIASLSGKTQTGGRLNLYKALTSGNSRPRNNNFADAFEIKLPYINSLSADHVSFSANNIDADHETGEPPHAGQTPRASVWWKYFSEDDKPITFTTYGSGIDTILAIYTGFSVGNLTSVAYDDDSGRGGTSQVTFTPQKNVAYHIAIDGKEGATGTVKLTMQTSSAAQPPALRFTLNSVARERANNRFGAIITGPPSLTVIVDRSTDCEFWTTNFDSFNLGSGSHSFQDNGASGINGFYRVRTPDHLTQVSENIVGYVDATIPNGNSLLSDPFVALDNSIPALFPAVDGLSISKWNAAGRSYTTASYDAFLAEWSNPSLTAMPGDGLLVHNPGSGKIVTFLGEIVRGYRAVPLPQGWHLKGSIIPQAGGVITGMRIPLVSGEEIVRRVNGVEVTYSWESDEWSVSPSNSPSPEPVISIGEGFWVHIVHHDRAWNRNFLVWPR